VLILDEPTEGIQPNFINQIGDTIKMLHAEGKMSILLVEQYLDFAKFSPTLSRAWTAAPSSPPAGSVR
jgi:ABC-type branched-subunit amino acid transport system ATPase component